MNRWFRLAAAVVAMIMIANLQYAWTLFVKPMIAAHHWKLSDVQWAFTFFIAAETWFMPCSGWLIDKLGPRMFVSIAGLLCGSGWAMLGRINSLPELYFFYTMAGVGAALVYCGSVGVGLKWFPDKRGLAAGLITAAFGSGTALFIPVIAHILKVSDYRAAFLYTGMAQGLLIVCAAQFLKNPATIQIAPKKVAAKVKVRSHEEHFNSIEMLRTPHFYVLYLMMLMMGIGGLMVTAQVAPLADSLKIGAPALTFALTLNPIANGVSRLFWGWVSDHLGRERTMVIAFFIQSACLANVMLLGRTSDTAFIVCLALVFFSWGEVYALFPPAVADFFGSRNVSSNYGFMYSTKGVASIVGGGVAALIFERTGSWSAVFYGSAVLAFCSACMAIGLMRMPLPKKKSNRLEMMATSGIRG
ncbi:MAG TPA: oxalate/formate MFS antiporter [Bryobacteraceae bacterium]|nr:oxalate/formate MFS antiporter [Bryobacteraceae bacterium]